MNCAQVSDHSVTDSRFLRGVTKDGSRSNSQRKLEDWSLYFEKYLDIMIFGCHIVYYTETPEMTEHFRKLMCGIAKVQKCLQ